MTGIKGHGRLVIQNNLAAIDQLAEFFNGIGAEQNWSADELFDINLCVEEAVVNVIVHGYEDNAEHQIEVTADYGATAVTITIVDDGIPYNPLKAKGANIYAAPEERTPGGLGVHLVRALMHTLTYSRDNGRNRLSMTKSLGAGI
ncbi:MAG: ATP-binding protein [Bryobacteraceae bacterium]|nr:ATP-binding protein [Bryobacteraceae bacterium]